MVLRVADCCPVVVSDAVDHGRVALPLVIFVVGEGARRVETFVGRSFDEAGRRWISECKQDCSLAGLSTLLQVSVKLVARLSRDLNFQVLAEDINAMVDDLLSCPEGCCCIDKGFTGVLLSVVRRIFKSKAEQAPSALAHLLCTSNSSPGSIVPKPQLLTRSGVSF